MFNKNNYPKQYTESQLTMLENHTLKHFGAYSSVFHEILSPDIHVDICIIEPNENDNCYTLVTQGAGAHKMNVPKKLRPYASQRAEFIIRLPKEWELNNNDEKWYWPIRWLKIISRLPIEQNTWIGYGHTIPNGEPFADNTKLSGILIEFPYAFDVGAMKVNISPKEIVQFYQLIPIYDEEMEYKLNNDAEALTNLFDENFSDIININRKNYCLANGNE